MSEPRRALNGTSLIRRYCGRFASTNKKHRLTKSLPQLLFRIAMIVVGGLISVSAHANIACGVLKISLKVSAGAVSVPVGTAVGTTVANVSPSTFQMNCNFVNRVNGATSATNYASFSTSQLVPGFTDVYATNIAGLGIRYTFNSSQCNATNVVMTNGSAKIGCYFSGPINGPDQLADITVTPTLVVTGAIAAGATTLSTVPAVSIVYSSDDQPGTWAKGNLFTGSASGSLIRATCSVTQTNVAVSLPNVSVGALSSVEATAGSQAFSLSFSCSTGAKVLITLTDSALPANQSNTLSLAAGSTAAGVGVQILNNGLPISFGPDSAAVGNINQWLIGASPSGPLQVPLTARYVRNGTVTAGTVKALATFTMSYQ